MRVLAVSVPNRITKGERFYDTQEILTEQTDSTTLWGLALHARALPGHGIFYIHGAQDF